MADKSEYGWMTVNEYLSDELASDSDDEKRIYRSERRAEKRVREKKRQRNLKRSCSYRAPSTSTQNVDRPYKRLGPCFKISIKPLNIFLMFLIFRTPLFAFNSFAEQGNRASQTSRFSNMFASASFLFLFLLRLVLALFYTSRFMCRATGS